MSFAPHPFSLRQLQYAVAVADTLSFRRAAEQCHVSQPSLSAQLAQLEEVLGVQLFERDRRRVLATEAGREIIERARDLIRDADGLLLAAASAGDPLDGTLRIGVIPTISPYLLPFAAPALRAAHPALRTLWLEDKTESLVEALDRGELDAAILAREAPIGDLELEVLATDPFMLATRSNDPLGAATPGACMADLADVDVLLLDDGHCFRDQVLSVWANARGRELEFRATSLATLVQMVAAGLGVTLLPQMAVSTEVQRAEIAIRPFDDPAPARTVVLAWRRRSPLAPAFGQIAATLRAAYPKA
jgi:LysR family hydrogen peroxide-inducible transcriptional activator